MPLKKLTEEIVFDHNKPLLPRLRRLVQLLELRLAASEAQRADYEGALSSMTGVALDRIDETITPLIAQTIEDIRTVASLFTAKALSTHAIVATGVVSFTIREEERNTFVALDFANVRPTA